MVEINFLDIGVLIFLAAFMVRGFLRGLVREVAGLVGLILAFVLARRFQNQMYDLLSPMFGGQEWTYLLAYALILMLVMAGVSLIAAGLRRLIAVSFSAWLDRIFGGILGLAKGLLLATVVFYMLRRLLPGYPVMETAQCGPLFDAMIRYLHNFLPSSLLNSVGLV